MMSPHREAGIGEAYYTVQLFERMMRPVSPIRQFFHYAGWYVSSLFGRKKPLVNTMVIHYGCNLRCAHCAVAANEGKLTGPSSMTWEMATREMRSEYEKGSRIVFFEGGEPTIWKDGDKGFEDLIAEAKRIGYYVTGYTTNGTGHIVEGSEAIAVSLDGPEEVHDRMRAPGVYGKLMENLGRTAHPNIFANMTISQDNMGHLRETAEIVARTPQLRGLMINFQTPRRQKAVQTPLSYAVVTNSDCSRSRSVLPARARANRYRNGSTSPGNQYQPWQHRPVLEPSVYHSPKRKCPEHDLLQ